MKNMKKVGKISSLAFSLMLIANNSLATTNTIESATENSNSGIGFLIIGILLIVGVLFIGYKMDESSGNQPTQKKVKPSKMPQKEEITFEKEINEESDFFYNENKNDIPYEKDENDYYETDNNVDFSTLDEDDEYEEDDVSLFVANQEVESSFEDVDDEINFEDAVKIEVNKDDFNSTMIFDSNELNNEIKEEQVEDELEYTEAVEGLNEKIDSLDELEHEEIQDAEAFMNELKKYEENVADDFEGFTTEKKSDLEETKKSQKRYTKKKAQVEDVDTDFLSNMEQNMKKDQETRMKKETKAKKTTKSTKKKKE